MCACVCVYVSTHALNMLVCVHTCMYACVSTVVVYIWGCKYYSSCLRVCMRVNVVVSVECSVCARAPDHDLNSRCYST